MIIAILRISWAKYLCLVVVVVAFAAQVDSQPGRHVRYRTNSGLSDNTIFDVNLGKEDMVWLSTNFGLNRFDGIEFNFYSKEQNELNSNFIQKSYEDTNGNIWILTQYHKTNNKSNFLNVLDPEADTIGSVQSYLGQSEMFADSAIHLITQARNSNDIWIVLNNGEVWKYGTSLDRIYKHNTPVNTFVALQSDKRNCFIVNDQFICFTSKWEIESNIKINKEIHDAFEVDGDIYVVHYTFSENIRIAINGFEANKINGLEIFKLENQKIDKVKTIDRSGVRIAQSRNLLFLLTQKTIHELNIETFEEGELIWESDQEIILDFEQLDETFYVIGTNDGVVLQNTEKKKFYTDLLGSSMRQIYSLPNGKHIYFTYSGQEDLELVPFQEALRKEEDIVVLGMSAFRSNDGCYWLGRHSSSARKICPGSNYLYDYPFKGRTGLDAHLMYQDKQSEQIWIGTTAGLSLVNETEKNHSIYTNTNGFDKIKSTFVNYFYENDRGLWVCTYDGIFLVDPEKGVVDEFSASTGHIPFNNVFHIHEDENGLFWLATKGGGLVEWKPFTKEYRTYNTSKGLSHNVIYAIYEDESGDFWMPSNYGVNRFDRETREVLNVYLKEDGLPEDEFNFLSHHQAADGTIYFGGINGVVSFNPKDFAYKRKDANIRIDQINVVSSDGELIDKTKDFRASKQITLSPQERSFVLDFHLQEINITPPRMYGYRFKGVEKSWNYTKEGYVRISSVPYGVSELELKGMSASGQWSDKVALVVVMAQQPFYTELWFLLSMLLLVFMIGFLYYRWKIKKVQRDKEKLELEVQNRTATIHKQKVQLEEQNSALASLNATKDRFFTIIAHDLRKPILAFRGIASKIDYLVSKEQFSRLKKLSNSIEESSYSLTNLLDNLLNWAQSQEGSLPYEPTSVDIQQIVDELIVVYDQLARNKGIGLETAVIPNSKVHADPRAVATVIRNLLDNAIKFSEPGDRIILETIKADEEVEILVEDTGVGIEAERLAGIFEFNNDKTTVDTSGERGPGLGLVLVKDLVKMNEGTVTIVSKVEEGTTVRVKLPKNKD